MLLSLFDGLACCTLQRARFDGSRADPRPRAAALARGARGWGVGDITPSGMTIFASD
jgi:hypothetical protein